MSNFFGFTGGLVVFFVGLKSIDSLLYRLDVK